jgi:hypothetical protein
MAVVWPPSVPQVPEIGGYAESMPAAMLRTEMDVGPAKQRRRFTGAVTPLRCAIVMSKAQLATLDEWFRVTLAMGSLPFEWTHPRTGALRTWRFTEPFVLVPILDGETWRVQLSLEMLP